MYFDLSVEVKNTTDLEKVQEEMLGYCTLVDNNGNQYQLIKIVEESNGKNLNGQTHIYKIKPQETILYHIIVEVPKEVANDTDNKLFVNLYINGENYRYQVR